MSKFPCRLYLPAPGGHADDVLLAMLEDALAKYDVAALMYAPDSQTRDDTGLQSSAQILKQCAMDHGVAFIVADDIAFAREIDADGVHISGDIETYKKARAVLGDDKTIGLSTPLNRHDSMCRGETGADYILFNPALPHNPSAKDAPSAESLIEWWSNLFEVPCVGQASTDTKQTRALINAGADFLALDDSLWNSKEGAAEILKSLDQLIAECGRKR